MGLNVTVFQKTRKIGGRKIGGRVDSGPQAVIYQPLALKTGVSII
jgi:hypothetical protein